MAADTCLSLGEFLALGSIDRVCGDALLEQNFVPDACRRYKRSLMQLRKCDAADAVVRTNLAETLLSRGSALQRQPASHEQAVADFRECVEVAPGASLVRARALHCLGLAERDAARLLASLRAYEECTVRGVGQAFVHRQLAELYAQRSPAEHESALFHAGAALQAFRIVHHIRGESEACELFTRINDRLRAVVHLSFFAAAPLHHARFGDVQWRRLLDAAADAAPLVRLRRHRCTTLESLQRALAAPSRIVHIACAEPALTFENAFGEREEVALDVLRELLVAAPSVPPLFVLVANVDDVLVDLLLELGTRHVIRLSRGSVTPAPQPRSHAAFLGAFYAQVFAGVAVPTAFERAPDAAAFVLNTTTTTAVAFRLPASDESSKGVIDLSAQLGPTNLAAPALPLVGRDVELRAGVRILQQTGLLVVHGALGSGKSALSASIALFQQRRTSDARVGGGVFRVSLRGVQCASDLRRAVAQPLGINARSCSDVCTELHQRRALLILDDVEDVDAAVATPFACFLNQLVCESVSVILTTSTSRRPTALARAHELRRKLLIGHSLESRQTRESFGVNWLEGPIDAFDGSPTLDRLVQLSRADFSVHLSPLSALDAARLATLVAPQIACDNDLQSIASHHLLTLQGGNVANICRLAASDVFVASLVKTDSVPRKSLSSAAVSAEAAEAEEEQQKQQLEDSQSSRRRAWRRKKNNARRTSNATPTAPWRRHSSGGVGGGTTEHKEPIVDPTTLADLKQSRRRLKALTQKRRLLEQQRMPPVRREKQAVALDDELRCTRLEIAGLEESVRKQHLSHAKTTSKQKRKSGIRKAARQDADELDIDAI